MCCVNGAVCVLYVSSVFFFKLQTAYEMRISDWSSDVCSSDLLGRAPSASYRIMSDREATVADAGGAWTDDWCAATHDRPSATMVERIWQHDLSCPVCGKSGR